MNDFSSSKASRRKLFRFPAFLKRAFNRLSVGQKVLTIVVVEILAYSVITSIALYQIHLMGTEIRQMADLYTPLLSAMESVRQQVQEERLQFKDVVFHGDRVVYDKESEETYYIARTLYEEASTVIDDRISFSEDRIRKAMASDDNASGVLPRFAPKLLEKLAAIRANHHTTTERMKRIFSHVEDGSFLMGMELINGVYASERKLLAEIDLLEAVLQDLKTGSVEYAVKVERNSSIMTVVTSVVTVCVAIAIFFLVIKGNISKPLHTLTDVINSFDPLDERTDSAEMTELMSRGDELGMVGRSLSELKAALRTQGKALAAAKDAAIYADRTKSRFLAAASHDLRQPLHAMQMYLAALRQRIRDRKTLAIISDTQELSLATGRLLNSLLDLSQLEAGAVVPQFRDFPVQELFNRLAISFLPLSYRKGLIIQVVPTHAIVNTDPILLERIVGNYLSNAVRYTETGKVLLGCRSRGAKVAIQVWDTGPGIPADQTHAIFDDFHQLHNEERDRGKGLGLGLGIVRRLSECLGHQIEHSSTVGRGSYFGVVVERGQSISAQALRGEMSEVYDDLAGTTVLLIEDDGAVLDATALLLRSWKCDVWCARTTPEAVRVVAERQEAPNVIVADYRLPGGSDGIDAIQQIQSLLKSTIPAIIVTGESDLVAVRRIEQTGYMILRKPVRPAKLRRLLNFHISHATFSEVNE